MTLPLFEIFILMLFPLIIGGVFYKKTHVSLKAKEMTYMVLMGIVLLALSLLISHARVGGTILQTSYGWPQYFLIFSRRDIVDQIEINKWVFDDRFYLYAIFNYLFYLSFIFLFITLIKHGKRK